MEKSFFYIVPKRDLLHYCIQLNANAIPFTLARHPGIQPSDLTIVFPDLPVRQFAVVHDMFHRVGISCRKEKT